MLAHSISTMHGEYNGILGESITVLRTLTLLYKSIANTSSGLAQTLVSVKGASKFEFICVHTILLNDTELSKETKELQGKLSGDG